MDSSLRFKLVAATVQPTAAPIQNDATVKDFRGIACPLNYIKTKMALAKLTKGQELLVLLDEQGAKNVPQSPAKDEHIVVSVTQMGDYWEVAIRKASCLST